MVFGWYDEPQRRSRPRFTQKEKEMLYQYQSGKCNGCEKKFAIRNMAVDHIRPFSQNGGERGSNLQLLCTACNSLKGTGTMAQLRKKLRAQGVLKSSTKTSGKSATGKKTTAAKKASTAKPASTKKRTTKKRPATWEDAWVDFWTVT